MIVIPDASAIRSGVVELAGSETTCGAARRSPGSDDARGAPDRWGGRWLVSTDRPRLEESMEIATMISWMVAAGVSLLCGHGVILGRISLGIGALAGVAGAALSIL
jgi:hypothetical protein